MNIAGLNVRITFQKSVTEIDEYQNHIPAWHDFYTCWATALSSGRSIDETQEAGHTEEADRLGITVRWSAETAAVNSKQYRILLQGRIYNILSIDEMGYKKNSRKFHAVLAER